MYIKKRVHKQFRVFEGVPVSEEIASEMWRGEAGSKIWRTVGAA
jgi:hypothetical protein